MKKIEKEDSFFENESHYEEIVTDFEQISDDDFFQENEIKVDLFDHENSTLDIEMPKVEFETEEAETEEAETEEAETEEAETEEVETELMLGEIDEVEEQVDALDSIKQADIKTDRAINEI